MKDEKVLSSKQSTESVTENSWRMLNAFTDARVGLGRAGVSVPTKHLLAFQLAHAQAKDAVHTALDVTQFTESLMGEEWSPNCAPLALHSRAMDRSIYLQRPDYGRLLNQESAQKLDQHRAQHPQGYDLAVIVVDGLSALAVIQNTLPFLNALFSLMNISKKEDENALNTAWTLAPICIVEQGRVAIGDDIGQRLNAKCVMVLIGERPGLSSPDSLGLYLTWGAKVGLTDAYRNCISNIRPAGLDYQEASRKARYLLTEASKRKVSGVALKDRSDEAKVIDSKEQINFLIT